MADKARMTTDDVELIKLKKYFRDVITKDDFNIDEYLENTSKWLELTGKEFDYDILIDKKKQDVLNVDKDIEANIVEIESVFEEDDTKKKLDSIVDKTQKKVTITGDDGKEVSKDRAHDLLSSMMLISKEEILAMYSDDKDFAGKSREEKKKTLISDVDLSFNLKTCAAAQASAIDPTKSKEENAKKIQQVFADYVEGKGNKVSIKEDHIVNAVTKGVETVKDKIASFKEKGFIKSAAKLMKHAKGILGWCKSKAINLKNALIQDMKVNTKQWKARGTAATVMIGATALGGPAAALAATGVYVAYEALSTPLWLINSKRNYQQWFNQDDSYRGWDGFKKAWKEMKANPEEMKAYKRQCFISAGVAVASGGLVYALSPVVQAANAAAQTATTVAAQQAANATAMGTVSMARVGTGLARVAGANANSLLAWYEAKREYKKNPNEYTKRKLEAARDGAIVTTIVTSAMEIYAVSHLPLNGNDITGNAHDTLQHASSSQASLGAFGNGHSDALNRDWAAPWQTGNDDVVNTTTADAANASADAAAQKIAEYYASVEVPTEWSPELGGTQGEWTRLMRVWSGLFGDKDMAEHLGGHMAESRAAFETAYRNLDTYMHFHPDAFGDKTTLEVLHGFTQRVAWSEIPLVHHADGHHIAVIDFSHANFAQYEPEMRELGKIICDGIDAKVDDSIDMNAAIKDVMPDGSIRGVIGTKNVRLAGIACGEVVHEDTVVPNTVPPTTNVDPDSLPPTPPVEETTTNVPEAPEPSVEKKVKGPVIGTDEEYQKANTFKASTQGNSSNAYGGAHKAGGQMTTNSGGKGELEQNILLGSKKVTRSI